MPRGITERRRACLQVLLKPAKHAVDNWDVTSALEVSGLDLLGNPQIIRIFAARAAEPGEHESVIWGWKGTK